MTSLMIPYSILMVVEGAFILLPHVQLINYAISKICL